MSWAEVIKINGDMTTSLDVTLGKRSDAAAAAVNGTNTAMAYEKGVFGIVNSPRAARFEANGTFTVPPWVNVVYLTSISAGGDGGQGYGGYAGGGGSCGNFVIRLPFFVTPGQQLAITVGRGNTVIGNLLTLIKGTNGSPGTGYSAGLGGKNVTMSNDYGAGGNGGARPSSGTVLPATPGTRGVCLDGISLFGSPAGTVPATTGGSGSGGGVPIIFVKPGTTGAGADGAAFDAASGNDGESYGAGASGGPGRTTGNSAGGIGGPGYVLIEW